MICNKEYYKILFSFPASATDSQPKVINLEWWQTPEKFKRRKVDDSEIDIINSGGADRLYC